MVTCWAAVGYPLSRFRYFRDKLLMDIELGEYVSLQLPSQEIDFDCTHLLQ